ncbi:MAG: DNA starvation/stationary phase protection protein [Thermonema sp.]|jgi:starvation-inducible DNA-binding protein|uniref:Dps family protein n=1 Tax=Thermonema TaxID=28194 RepID=UPI0005719B98|nr:MULTISPECIES: Dps family protein [Thermonema]GIV38243.1 MAG: DNA starvation/stationary phase protection protein [Thermonema sp.]
MEKVLENNIGLANEATTAVIEKLNTLLATYQVYYQNLRGFHWNIEGENFFTLHAKFEELYTGAQAMIDTIAERILTLGGTPLHTFADYMEHATIQAAKNVRSDKESVSTLIENIQALVALERETLKAAEEAEDEGTIDMLAGDIKAKEKDLWMLRAFLKRQ